MWTDNHYEWLKPLRYQLGFLLVPSQSTALMPKTLIGWFSEAGTSKQELIDENNKLIARNLTLELRSQRLAALEMENKELRELLNASEQVEERTLVASVQMIDPAPFSQQLLINKGGEDGVFIGQPVLDAYGLLGQVVDVRPYTAVVMMIADANHAVPVQVNRNGLRSIAVGTGALDELELSYVQTTADIKVGDLLISSGLGNRFPKGYPVAVVSSVKNISGQAFAEVKAKPQAQLDRSRYLMLVFNKGTAVPDRTIWQGRQ